MSAGSAKQELRIVLDAAATSAFNMMVQALKIEMATALAEAQKIKSKRRRKATNAAASNPKTKEAVTL